MRVLVFAVLVGCGAGDSGDADELCDSYEASGGACVNEQNLAQCREMARECRDGVVVLESCPLQFACE